MTEKGSPLYQIALFILSIYVLFVLVVESFVVSDPEIKQVLQYIDTVICFVFLFDFFANLVLAKDKIQYLKWGWIDLLSSIPAIDPLRWGRLSRLVRIIRFLRAIKSVKILFNSIINSKIQSLTIIVFMFTFIIYSLSASMIIEFERSYGSSINDAEMALRWAFMNLVNAKVTIIEAKSPEGIFATILLNKVGLLVFAYFNALLIAWLIEQRKDRDQNVLITTNKMDDES